jgi:hypothetical protein
MVPNDKTEMYVSVFIKTLLSLSQNSVSFGRGFRKSGLKPAFSNKIQIAFPKLN